MAVVNRVPDSNRFKERRNVLDRICLVKSRGGDRAVLRQWLWFGFSAIFPALLSYIGQLHPQTCAKRSRLVTHTGKYPP